MSPLSLVTHGASQSAHHRLMGNAIGQMPNLLSHEIEQRMIECIKMWQNNKEAAPRPQSPDCINRAEALNALEMSRVALWSMYNNNTSPPTSVNTTSPPNHEPQREALNLAESPVHSSIKREREDYGDREEREYCMPPVKKSLTSHNHYKQDHHRRSSSPSSPDHHSTRSDRERHERGSRRHLSASPPAHRNGNNSLNGSADLLNACSPIALLSGMQFKLSSRGKCFFIHLT